jgi:hypothetical protein
MLLSEDIVSEAGNTVEAMDVDHVVLAPRASDMPADVKS